jgi:hypothetical protein
MAARAATGCGLGLIGCVAGMVAVMASSAEEMELLAVLGVAFFLALPLALWLLTLTLMVAGRRSRFLSAGKATGLVIAVPAALSSLGMAAHGPSPALLVATGFTAFGVGFWLLLRRPDVHREFLESDASARTGSVTGLRRIRRRALTALGVVVALYLLYVVVMGLVVQSVS